MTFSPTFGRLFSPTFQPKSVAKPAGGWWDLNGTITSCVAAYQPKGAASYAASLTDLSGNSNDATNGTVYPTWDSTNGWKGNKTAKAYLDTGITVPEDQDISIIIRVSNLTDGIVMAAGLYPKGYGMVQLSVTNIRWLCWSYVNTTGAIDGSGTLAMIGRYGYTNGVATGYGNGGTYPAGISIKILGEDGSSFCSNAYVQAAAIYKPKLTVQNIEDLHTAMAAL